MFLPSTFFVFSVSLFFFFVFFRSELPKKLKFFRAKRRLGKKKTGARSRNVSIHEHACKKSGGCYAYFVSIFSTQIKSLITRGKKMKMTKIHVLEKSLVVVIKGRKIATSENVNQTSEERKKKKLLSSQKPPLSLIMTNPPQKPPQSPIHFLNSHRANELLCFHPRLNINSEIGSSVGYLSAAAAAEACFTIIVIIIIQSSVFLVFPRKFCSISS